MAEVIKPAKYSSPPATHTDFLKKQEKVFNEGFRLNRKVDTEGISSTLPQVEHCYYIGLMYQDAVMAQAELFSREIATRVPAVAYARKDLHTTLANGYITQGDFKPDGNVMDRLSDLVCGLKSKSPPRQIYFGMLYNHTSVIAASYASKEFFDLVYEINQGAKERGLDLNFPWGSHMSISRFNESRTPDNLGELKAFLDSAQPIGEAHAKRISFGTAFTTKNEFRLDECGSIEF